MSKEKRKIFRDLKAIREEVWNALDEAYTASTQVHLRKSLNLIDATYRREWRLKRADDKRRR